MGVRRSYLPLSQMSHMHVSGEFDIPCYPDWDYKTVMGESEALGKMIAAYGFSSAIRFLL